MRAYKRGYRNAYPYLLDLFTWVGRRMAATEHLEIHTDCKLWEKQDPDSTPEALLSCLRSSGNGMNANMKILELTIEDRRYLHPSAPLMGRPQDWVIPFCSRLDTVSLSLDKAPLWLMSCPTLRHICLFFPPLQEDETGLCSRSLAVCIP